MLMDLDLALVMPVYNEEACIAQVVQSWRDALAALGIRFRLIVLNDGSHDGTREALAPFEGDPAVTVIHKSNSGHGPTILMGYRQAVEMAPWVFQCDSDEEMSPEHFPPLWKSRKAYDVLFGTRQGRRQNAARRIISAGSRLTVRLLFGKGVVDVNTPYRLMRSDLLKVILTQIPEDTFAPNIIISGTLARAGARIWNYPVPHEGRRTGTASIVKWKLWKSAWKALWQTLRCRPALDIGQVRGPPR
jgi:dolichol-phosphate mannosyltransferase